MTIAKDCGTILFNYDHFKALRPARKGKAQAVFQSQGVRPALWAEQVVPKRKEHQGQHQGDAHGHQNPQRAIAGRFAGHGLIGVKHQMPAVQGRDWEEVQQTVLSTAMK